MKCFIKIISLLGLMAVAQLAYSAPITDTYTGRLNMLAALPFFLPSYYIL